MKISKIFFPLFSSLLAVVPVQISTSCSWSYDEDQNFISPFNAELPDIPEYYPFFYSSHYFNGDPNTDYSENTLEDAWEQFDPEYVNVYEWVAYFKNQVTDSHIDDLIYQSSLEDFNMFADYVSGRSASLPKLWQENELLDYWKKHPEDPSFEYLYMAKKIEPLVQTVDPWETVTRDVKKLSEFGALSLKKIETVKDPFLKLRYTYQAMRCAHYTGHYDECIKLYDKNVLAQDESLIKYWCLSLKAGAYWRLNKFAEASYYNSIVFDKCLSRRLSSERDFWIDSDDTWQKCLAMCKNDHERNMLWFLTGINQNNSAIPALYEMIKIDPSSKEVEVLLARELEKIQRNYMPQRWAENFDDPEEEGDMRPESNDLNEIYIFITTTIKTGRVHTPAFWQCGAAFIQYINKEYQSCDNHCQLAMAAAGSDEELAKQAAILKTLNKVEAAGKIDAQIEARILPDVQWIFDNKDPEQEYADTHSEDAYRLIMYRLMKYYTAADKPVQAEMCRAKAVEYYDIYEQPEKVPVDALYSYFTDNKKTPFDAFLARQYPYNADDMMEIKGTLLMRNYDWNEAIAAFQKMKDPSAHEKMQLPTDPFLIHINDCHDCDFNEHSANYTKLSFCEKMQQLTNTLTAKDISKSQTAHQLANAYYNISYWGNSWMALDYYRCHGCEANASENAKEPADWYTADLFDMKKAMEYYKLAAESTKDREFVALNTFMLAKCEQNNYFVSADYTYENEGGKKNNYRSNFSSLKNDYKDTKFYKQAVTECKYFDYYVHL